MLFLSLLLAASPDAEVTRIFKGAEDFSPAQFMQAMKAVEALGPDAVPAVAKRLDAERGPNTLWTICEALNRYPGEGALPSIENRLDHESWLVRGSCTRAFGAALVKGGRTPERMKRIRAMIDSNPDCGVRIDAAETIGPLEDPGLRADFELLLTHPGCDRKVALFGLRSAKKDTAAIGARILAILQDTHEDFGTRESATQALGQLAYGPARPYLRTLLVGEDPGMNIRSFAIDALGAVGTQEDLALLREVIASDPYHGEGVWAVSGREAMARIKKRGR